MEVDEIVPTENKQSAAQQFGYEGTPQDPQAPRHREEASTEAPRSVEEQINEILKTAEVDSKGKLIYPDGISPEMKAAVAATKSFRDTQSSYTKSQQEKKVREAELEATKEQLAKYESPTAGLSQEDQTKLAELKFTNPDAWYMEMKKLEAASSVRLDEKFGEITEQARNKTVEEIRVGMLEEYNKSTDKPLTQDQLDNDVPPRWKQEVMDGTLDFGEFLHRSATLIHGKKVVANPEIDTPTNINDLSGGSKDPKIEEGIDYSKVTF